MLTIETIITVGVIVCILLIFSGGFVWIWSLGQDAHLNFPDLDKRLETRKDTEKEKKKFAEYLKNEED